MNPMFHIFKSLFPAVAMALLLSACSAVNWDYPRMPSNAFAHPETTSVGALFQEAADKHPGLSGFSLVQHLIVTHNRGYWTRGMRVDVEQS